MSCCFESRLRFSSPSPSPGMPAGEGAVNTRGRSRSRLQFVVVVGLVLVLSFPPASSPGAWTRPSSSLGCYPWRTASARSGLGGSSANKSGGVPDLEDHQRLYFFFCRHRGDGDEEDSWWSSRSCRLGWCKSSLVFCGGLRSSPQ